MREGLRSQTSKFKFDLNEDPVEDGSSSNPSSYYSAGEKVDPEADFDISSNAVDGGVEVTRADKGREFSGSDGEILGGFDGNTGCVSSLTKDADDINGALQLDDINGVEIKNDATGKGRPGRKRKMVGCGQSSVQSVEGAPITDEIVTAARVEEDGSKHENFVRVQNADVGGSVAADPTGSTDECRQIPNRGRRGRKRKVLVGSGGNNDNADAGGKAKRLALDGSRPQIVGRVLRSRTREDGIRPQTVGRVLRSRTREANADEMLVCAEEKVHGDSNCKVELELSASRNLDMENEDSARRVVKRGRGRPPAAKRGENVNENSNCEVELDLSAGRNLDMEIEESARPAVKRGRGRPPAAKHGEKVVHGDSNCESELELFANRNLDMENEDSSRPTVKRGRGRPPAAKRGEKVHVNSNCEVELELSASRNLDMDIEESARPAVKRGRGRPPASKHGEKVHADSNCEVELEYSGSRNLDMDIEDSARRIVKRGRGRPPAAKHGEKVHADSNSEVELELFGSRNLDMEIEEKARPAVKHGCGRPPAAKRGRGRPPKVHGKNGSSKATLRNKTKLAVYKEVTLPGRNVVKGHKLVKLRKKKVKSALLRIHKENNTDKNEMGLKPKEEKQLLKEQITGILKQAGWTIEYRPRNGRDYLDAVYVDGQGRTHWSVTLAYQKLKLKIEDGTADEKEKSAFTPIPGDKLSKLFRITKEGNKSKMGLNSSGIKNGGSKARSDKKSAGECISVPKKKANGTHQGSEGVHCEQENSISDPCTRKAKSRRKGSRRSGGPSAREATDEPDEGKRTLLAWMIDLGTFSVGDRVQYINHERTDMTQEGKITREGICCECCGKLFSLDDFEYHHIGSMLGQPLQNICLETGQSLLQCMTDSWRKQEEIHHISFNFVDLEDDPADDICNICADGGDLICCDGCPSTFHQSCLQIQNCPTGDWHCIYCSCKFCGMFCWENSLEDKVLGPNLSGNNVPDPDYFGYFTCLFCEEKFHVSCALRNEDASINTEVFQFCGSGCQKLFENLQKLLGVKHELENGYSWTILRRQDLSCTADPLKVESNSKLAIALSIIDECFTPIIDERSSINVIRNVCYSCGSNIKRLNYTAFCTFILEKDDELVSAATIRVHGNKLAEMPFIGTRFSYRRKGMARRLLNAIEMALSSIDVEKLVIPAVSELSETWTKVFGFVPLEESKRQEMKYMSLVLFPGNDMLEKPLCKSHTADGKISSAGMDSEPSKELVNEKSSPTDDAYSADVGSGLHLNCNVSDPGHDKMNGSVDSISSKDAQYHEFVTSEVKLETSHNGISGKNQVENISCASPDEAKEAMKSQTKAVVFSQ